MGKTAVFKYLSETNKKSGTIVIDLSPEEYSYEILSSILKKESDGNWGKQFTPRLRDVNTPQLGRPRSAPARMRRFGLIVEPARL